MRVERIVAGLPVHRDSVSGRRNAYQIRFLLMAVGIAIVALWESTWAPLALVICATALVLPVSQARRRHLVASLRAKRQGEQIVRVPGIMTIDATHVEVTCSGESLRRLRRKGLRVTGREESLELVSGAKKRERLLVTSEEPEGEELWIEADRGAVEKALAL